jgi:hypothetical protein
MPAITKIIREVAEGLTTPLVGYLENRAKLKQARFEAKLALEKAIGDRQAKLISEGLAADANWEMEFARQAQGSYKDEYVLGVVSIPAVLCFIKFGTFDGPGIVTAGFVALAATPLWFQILLCSLFAATVGIRWWRRTQYDTVEVPSDAAKKLD